MSQLKPVLAAVVPLFIGRPMVLLVHLAMILSCLVGFFTLIRYDQVADLPLLTLLATLAVAAVISAVNLKIYGRKDDQQTAMISDPVTRLPTRAAVLATLDDMTGGATSSCSNPFLILLEIDHFRKFEELYDDTILAAMLRETAHRIKATLPATSHVGRLDGPCFAAIVPNIDLPDLDAALLYAGKLQRSLASPILLTGKTISMTISVGLAAGEQVQDDQPGALLRAATTALIDAQRDGPSAIRSYSAAMRQRIAVRTTLIDNLEAAMDRGEIRAYFQPQVSSETNEVSGFEALARWERPEHGLVPPGEFLPALEQAGLLPRLGDIMIENALTALARWDRAGFNVPQVAVNFSHDELSDPLLVDKIAFALDRHGLTPARLIVEVLETVVASQTEDILIRNLSALSRLGCCLDLDDFGTGHASITSIRKLSIERIKIDRSFITGLDQDADQQRMVAAILTMAARLGIGTLAEGIETAAERECLRKLGCGHLQGFGIGRPMPLEETEAWMQRHTQGNCVQVTQLNRQAN